jgi:hypothetical protein
MRPRARHHRRYRHAQPRATPTAEATQTARVAFTSGYNHSMPVTLPLNEMSISEKLQLMEALWEDLSRNVEALESPEWHREVLEERERRIVSGEAGFSSWEQAKADIRKRVS